MFALSVIVLGVFVSVAAFFAKEDRADIKAQASRASALAQEHDRDIAVLKQSLLLFQSDLQEIKSGQRLLLSRYGLAPRYRSDASDVTRPQPQPQPQP